MSQDESWTLGLLHELDRLGNMLSHGGLDTRTELCQQGPTQLSENVTTREEWGVASNEQGYVTKGWSESEANEAKGVPT